MPTASPHSHAKVLKATVTVLMQRLELTHRQAEVLHWIAEGKTNDEIRIILGCSFFTVKNHVRKIFQRLGVHSRTAAAASAYRAHIHGAHAAAKAPAPSSAPATQVL
ncbi:MAG: helix-turn-helix domain-containing protein [Prosthecobacter sp.]